MNEILSNPLYLGIGAGAVLLVVVAVVMSRRRTKSGPKYMEEVRLLVAAGKLKSAAMIQRKHGNLKEALNLLERGKNYKEASRVAAELELYPRAADLAEKAKEFERAADLFAKAGDYGRAGKLYKRNGLFRKAAEAFEKDSESTMDDIAEMWEKACLEIMPDDAVEAFNQAELRVAINMAEKAADCYKKAGNNERAAMFYQMAQRDQVARQLRGKNAATMMAKMTSGPVSDAPVAHTGEEARLAQVVGHAVKAAMDHGPPVVVNAAGGVAPSAIGAAPTGASVTPASVREIVYIRDQATNTDTAINRSNDRYEIGEKLGEGGMAVVYRATDKILDREVAMKFLPEGLAENLMALKYFQREAKAAAGINHANVVTIYDCGVIDDRPFICMELISGEPLDERLDAFPEGLPMPELYDVAEGLLAGLQAAHERGVVHRDIKPSNVMISPEGVVKLMDFGIAGSGDPKKSTVIAGTPHYMAPEQFVGKGIDHRTDLFAVGATLYELLTGTSAYESADRARLPAPPRKLRAETPMALDRMILSCLARAPEDRPETAESLLNVIRRLKKAHTQEAIAMKSIAEPMQLPADLTADPESLDNLFETGRLPVEQKVPVASAHTLAALGGRPRPEAAAVGDDSDFNVTVDPSASEQERFLARALALEPETGPALAVDPALGRAAVPEKNLGLDSGVDRQLQAYLESRRMTAHVGDVDTPSADEEILSLDEVVEPASLDEDVKDILSDYLSD